MTMPWAYLVRVRRKATTGSVAAGADAICTDAAGVGATGAGAAGAGEAMILLSFAS